MKNRHRDILPDGTPIYRLSSGAEYDLEITPLIERYRELYMKIAKG